MKQSDLDDLEAREGSQLDAWEEAFEQAEAEGDSMLAEFGREVLALWKDGVFPDGTRCKRDNTRVQAQKLLQAFVLPDGKRERYRVHFVLDAKVDDPRVSSSDVEEMFGDDGTEVNVTRPGGEDASD